MAISVVRFGTARKASEGLRIGTVRRPPRGVPKSQYAKRGFYDLWLPELSPSPDLIAKVQAGQDERTWKDFERHFRKEMSSPMAARLLDLLAGLSHQTNLSVGCYCENENRCHRSILRKLLVEHGADMAPR